MIRYILLLAGFLLIIFQQFVQPLTNEFQFILFITGVILLGVPHGAADLLVATRNAEDKKKSFSQIKFLVRYLSRLFLFAAILWFFPLAGNLLFILFAAYHFGETDLYQFKTNTISGKLFVISYGLVILGVILLNHFEEVKPMFSLFDAGTRHEGFINFIDQYRYSILSFCTLLFFVSTFFYFSTKESNHYNKGSFLIQFALILFILYHLPMLLGFTFYFIVWHSLLSLRNITAYLRKDGLFASSLILKQIGIYSLLAIGGIFIFGLAGFMFVNNNSMLVYVFLGLAVLTAPHMQVMHNMYNSIRSRSRVDTGI